MLTVYDHLLLAADSGQLGLGSVLARFDAGLIFALGHLRLGVHGVLC